MTIGETIRNLRKSKGLTQTELADLMNFRFGLNVDRVMVSKWETGYATPYAYHITRLADVFGVSSDYLLRGEKNTGSRPSVPLLGRIACGDPILAGENIEELIPLPEGVRADFALKCKGDSMINARILDGDTVYIRQQPTVENGEIAAVMIDGEATLKRFYRNGDAVTLMPENPAYRPITLIGAQINNINVIGKAVAFTSIIDNR